MVRAQEINMMTLSIHHTNTQYLQPALGILHSAMVAVRRAVSGTFAPFGIGVQGRKPSGLIWSDALFGLGNAPYAPANNNESANDTRRRCRSHRARFHI